MVARWWVAITHFHPKHWTKETASSQRPIGYLWSRSCPCGPVGHASSLKNSRFRASPLPPLKRWVEDSPGRDVVRSTAHWGKSWINKDWLNRDSHGSSETTGIPNPVSNLLSRPSVIWHHLYFCGHLIWPRDAYRLFFYIFHCFSGCLTSWRPVHACTTTQSTTADKKRAACQRNDCREGSNKSVPPQIIMGVHDIKIS